MEGVCGLTFGVLKLPPRSYKRNTTTAAELQWRVHVQLLQYVINCFYSSCYSHLSEMTRLQYGCVLFATVHASKVAGLQNFYIVKFM